MNSALCILFFAFKQQFTALYIIMNSNLSTDIRFLKGIGETRAAAFYKLGVVSVRSLLELYPRMYEDWENVTAVFEAPFDEFVCIKGTPICPPGVFKTRSGYQLTKTVVSDGEGGLFEVVFFNNKYIASMLKEGVDYLFFGKLRQNEHGGAQMTAPKFVRTEGGGGLHAVYPQTAGLTSKMISTAVKNALASFADSLTETLPEDIVKKYRLISRREAVKLIHFPKNRADVDAARRRLIYEELLTLQLALKYSRASERQKTSFAIRQDKTGDFLPLLPFELTGAQKRTIEECAADMQKDVPMRRLVQGDVGSGKTAVAAALIYSAAKNGFQSALMAPTEVLAKQHLKTFTKFYENTDVSVALLTGSTPAKEKRETLEKLKNGEIQLLIGTHAVISAGVEFRCLGLAVTDEQHRFGVNQRAALREKGEQPHVLVMSATPIPRTLSLIVYGDLDISVIDEKPAGRQPVDTFAVTSDYHPRLYKFIKKQLDAGRQGYIVCPLVEENEENPSERIAAESYVEELSQTVFRDYCVGLLHGKMKQKEKDAVMTRFASGEIQLLICTVVIEVGVDVPNANIIVIENAECFGLSQLHQLRGRTGRGKDKAYCVLVSDAKNDYAKQRFDTMCATDDGFKIAEEDLKLRGPGDFFGSRQSGLPDLKLADLMSDTRILYAAASDAESILKSDPGLLAPGHAFLKEKAAGMFADIS